MCMIFSLLRGRFLDTCQVHSSSVLAGEGVGFKKSIGTARQMNEREHLGATAFLWAIYLYIYSIEVYKQYIYIITNTIASLVVCDNLSDRLS